jgi:hypothetical protein
MFSHKFQNDFADGNKKNNQNEDSRLYTGIQPSYVLSNNYDENSKNNNNSNNNYNYSLTQKPKPKNNSSNNIMGFMKEKDKSKKTKEEDDYFNFNLKSKNINQDDYSNKFKDLFPFDYSSQIQVESKPPSHILKTSINNILF